MELVLNTYGAKLSSESQAFLVSNAGGKQRIPITGIDTILVAKSAVITTDALMLAINNDIQVILADRSGNIAGCVWSHKYGSISTIRKGQLAFCASQDAVTWIKGIIVKKMQNHIVYSLLVQDIITSDYYSTDEQGAVWLEALGRRIMIQSVNDYLSEVETMNGIRRIENFSYLDSFVLDIDLFEKKDTNIEELKKQIAQDDRVAMTFISPNGNGTQVAFLFG